jgi:YtkA-like protein
MKKLVVVAAVALVTAGAAQAGNWASVELAAVPPAGVQAGKAWTATFSVLRHGLASQPVDGVQPTLTIKNTASGEAETFRATPVGKPGVYRARVVFPSAGTWSYAIYDGFTWYGHAQTHEFGLLRVGRPAAGNGFPAWELGGALVGAAALGTLMLGLRRTRPSPKPATQP